MENKPITVRLPDSLRESFNKFRDGNFHSSDNAAIVAIVGAALSGEKVMQSAAQPVMQVAAPIREAEPIDWSEIYVSKHFKEAVREAMSGFLDVQRMHRSELTEYSDAIDKLREDFDLHRHGEGGGVLFGPPPGMVAVKPTEPTKAVATPALPPPPAKKEPTIEEQMKAREMQVRGMVETMRSALRQGTLSDSDFVSLQALETQFGLTLSTKPVEVVTEPAPEATP